MTERFSDEKLEKFYREFQLHVENETKDREQLEEVYDALFRQEDKIKNHSAGLIQLTLRLSEQLERLEERDKKHKTFIGGVLFAFSTMWIFLTDVGAKVVKLLHSLGGSHNG